MRSLISPRIKTVGVASVLKVLIVKLSSLGDVVHAMPAVQDMRAAMPNVQIDWVVERGFAPLVARCTGVNRVITCELRNWRKKPFAAQTRTAWRKFKADLQQQEYDAVIDLQGLTKSALISRLARTSPQGLRYAMANRTDGSGYEAPTRWVADRAIALAPHVHAVDRSRMVCAQALGYRYTGSPVCGLVPQGLAVEPAQPVKMANAPTMSSKPMVALVQGTSRADKEWPLQHWVALGRQLNQTGLRVSLPQGNAQELSTSQAIAAQLDDAWLWPAMALDAVCDTLAQCAGVIGVDSGLSHIAVALGLPHVQIYNFDTAWRTGPQTHERHRSVFASPCPDVQSVWQAWASLAPAR